MSDVILHIFSFIGITLLILLGTALFLILLLMFWPVTYRVKGEKGPEVLWVTARADWLFGIFRVRYAYPEPGILTAKLLWKNLIKDKEKGQKDSGGASEHRDADKSGGSEAVTDATTDSGAEAAGIETGNADATTDNGAEAEGTGTGSADAITDNGAEAAGTETGNADATTDSGAEAEGTETGSADAATDNEGDTAGTETAGSMDNGTGCGKFHEKIQKIKYTILKLYDRIKEVWANISYYMDLLREEDTALLWRHVKLRLGKILKNIRPRHIEANVLFGTGAPDTTGIAYGVYSMLLPALGRGICVTPDFGRAILEGNIDVRGHITLYTLTWNALRLLLDRKLQLFIKKMKGGRKANGR